MLIQACMPPGRNKLSQVRHANNVARRIIRSSEGITRPELGMPPQNGRNHYAAKGVT
jgi:hypothetical protein